MANTAYAVIGGVQAQVIDMAGDVSPGGQVIYSVVVLGPDNNPVAQPGTLNFYYPNRPVTFSVSQGASTQTMQNAVKADVQALWGDNALTVVFL